MFENVIIYEMLLVECEKVTLESSLLLLIIIQVHKMTVSPEFDEDFVFDIGPSDLSDRTLEILIYDATPSSTTLVTNDECLGQVLLPFDEISLQSTTETVWMWKGVTPYTQRHEVLFYFTLHWS